MPISFVQLIGSGRVDSGTVITLHPPSAVAAGDLVTVFTADVLGALPQPSSVVDSKGNTYSWKGDTASGAITPHALGAGLTVSRIAVALATSDTITITFGTSGTYTATLAEFSDTTDLGDGSSGQHGSGLVSGGHTSLSPVPPLATGNADDLLLGVAVCTDTGAAPWSAPAGWTLLDQIGSGAPAIGSMITAYLIQTVTGSYNPPFGYTGASSSGWVEAFFAFKFGLPPVPVSPVAIAPTARFGRPRILGQVIFPAGIASTAAFGAPTLGELDPQYVRPFGWQEVGAVGTPTLTVSSTSDISPSGIAPGGGVGEPFIFQSDIGSPPRNYLIDRQTREVYPWPVNHASEDSVKTIGRRLTRSGISASGKLIATRKVFLIRHPTHPGPVHLLLHGSFIDRSQLQYHTFLRFFDSCDDRTFDFIDASGDSYHVQLVQFDARRQNSAARTDGSYIQYQLECEVLDVNEGAYRGVAV